MAEATAANAAWAAVLGARTSGPLTREQRLDVYESETAAGAA